MQQALPLPPSASSSICTSCRVPGVTLESCSSSLPGNNPAVGSQTFKRPQLAGESGEFHDGIGDAPGQPNKNQLSRKAPPQPSSATTDSFLNSLTTARTSFCSAARVGASMEANTVDSQVLLASNALQCLKQSCSSKTLSSVCNAPVYATVAEVF